MFLVRQVVLGLLFCTLLLMPAVAQSQTSKDDSLKTACLAKRDIVGNPISDTWCQCQNDYYANLLNDTDWEKYTFDYFALERAKDSQSSTPANSYARNIQLGDSHCRTCKENDYKGCLRNDGHTPTPESYSKMLNDLRDGVFGEIPKNILYKNFFVDYVNGYSAFCGDRISDYSDRTITSTEWKSVNHIWWEGDTTIFKVRVDNRLFADFERYEDQVSDDLKYGFGWDLLTGMFQGDASATTIGKAIKRTVGPMAFMRTHLSGRCEAPDVAATYENLYRFNVRQAPVVNPKYTKARALRAEAARVRKANIIEATNLSYKKARVIYAEKKKRDALKLKPSFSCPDVRKSAQMLATPIKGRYNATGADFSTMNGAWSGEWNGQTVEIAVWASPRGNGSPGLAYFPKYDCLMKAGMRSDVSHRDRSEIASLNFRMLNVNQRPNNCAAMVLEDRDREIHHFRASGFMNFDPASRNFTWYADNGKLSKISPQSCNNIEGKFAPSKVSPAFYDLISKHHNFDKRGVPMPEEFLQQIK